MPQDLSDPTPQPRQSHLEDAQLAHAVSLSLKVHLTDAILSSSLIFLMLTWMKFRLLSRRKRFMN